MSDNASRPNTRLWAFANQSVYDGPDGVHYNIGSDERGYDGRIARGRGRGGGWLSNGGNGREENQRVRRGNNGGDNRRNKGSRGWRHDRRDDCRNDDQEKNSLRFGGNAKAK